jgi:hypothetical protein
VNLKAPRDVAAGAPPARQGESLATAGEPAGRQRGKRRGESHELWAGAVVAVALVAALASGPHRAGALVGAGLSGAAGLLSIAAMGRWAVAGGKLQPALAVLVLGFLGRILLVSIGTIVVVKTSASVPGFVVGFFVSFFALVGIEVAYVQRLGRRAGSSP